MTLRLSLIVHVERAAPKDGPLPIWACLSSDFTRWKEHSAHQKALDRLLRDLRVEKA